MLDQLAHARTLISLIHPAPHAQALIEMTSMPSKKRAFKQYFFYAELAAQYAIEETVKGHSVYVSLNPRSQMSAFETDVPYVSTIGLDLQPEKTPIEEVEKRLGLRQHPSDSDSVQRGWDAHVLSAFRAGRSREGKDRVAAALPVHWVRCHLQREQNFSCARLV